MIVNYARQMYPSSSKGVSSSVASAAIEQAQWSMVLTAILEQYSALYFPVMISCPYQQSLAMKSAARPQVQQVMLKSV